MLSRFLSGVPGSTIREPFPRASSEFARVTGWGWTPSRTFSEQVDTTCSPENATKQKLRAPIRCNRIGKRSSRTLTQASQAG